MSENYGYNPAEFEEQKAQSALADHKDNFSPEEQKATEEKIKAHFQDLIDEQIEVNPDWEGYDEKIASLENPKIIPSSESVLELKKDILALYKQANESFFSLERKRARQARKAQKEELKDENLPEEWRKINQDYFVVRNQIVTLENFLTRLDAIQEKLPTPSLASEINTLTQEQPKEKEQLQQVLDEAKNDTVKTNENSNFDTKTSSKETEEEKAVADKQEDINIQVEQEQEAVLGDDSDEAEEEIFITLEYLKQEWLKLQAPENVNQIFEKIISDYDINDPEIEILVDVIEYCKPLTADASLEDREDDLDDLFLDLEILFEDMDLDLNEQDYFFSWLENKLNEAEASTEAQADQAEKKITAPETTLATLEKKIDKRQEKIQQLRAKIDANPDVFINPFYNQAGSKVDFSYLPTILFSTQEYEDDLNYLLDQAIKKDDSLKNVKRLKELEEKMLNKFMQLKNQQSEFMQVLSTNIKEWGSQHDLEVIQLANFLQNRFLLAEMLKQNKEAQNIFLSTFDQVLKEKFLQKIEQNKNETEQKNNQELDESQRLAQAQALYEQTLRDLLGSVVDEQKIAQYQEILASDPLLKSPETFIANKPDNDSKLKEILETDLSEDEQNVFEINRQLKEIEELLVIWKDSISEDDLKKIKEKKKNLSNTLSKNIEGKTALEKQLLTIDDIDGFLSFVYDNGVEGRAKKFYKAKIDHLLEKQVKQDYDSKEKMLIEQVKKKQTSEEEQEQEIKTIEERIKKDYQIFCEYALKLYEQALCESYKYGNVNTSTFQERTSGGRSKLIGYVNKQGEIIQGSWAGDSDVFKSNIEFNKIEAIGIKEGFDPITQRNKEGVGEGKLQTIVAEINEILGYPHRFTEKYVAQHPQYKKYFDAGITSGQYNVDSLINSGIGGDLVDKLMTLHKDDLFVNEWFHDKLEDNAVLNAYKQGIMYLAARNDLTSTNFIKLVGTRNKSLHPSCAESMRPFGFFSAMTRALYKGDRSGYLALTDSWNPDEAITQDEIYEYYRSNEGNNFYQQIKKIKEIYRRRELVDYPQREAIKKRKHIFKPEKWHHGFIPRATIACSLGKTETVDSQNQRDLTPANYLAATQAFMKIVETSLRPPTFNSSEMFVGAVENYIGDISTQCSILGGAITGASFESDGQELGHINQAVLALFETAIEKVFLSIEGSPRVNSFNFMDQYGRDYINEYQKVKHTIVKKIFDPGSTKEPFRTKILEFLGLTVEEARTYLDSLSKPMSQKTKAEIKAEKKARIYEIQPDDHTFMRPIQFTGFSSTNDQIIANRDYHIWLEKNYPDMLPYSPNERFFAKNEYQKNYPEPVALLDKNDPFKTNVSGEE